MCVHEARLKVGKGQWIWLCDSHKDETNSLNQTMLRIGRKNDTKSSPNYNCKLKTPLIMNWIAQSEGILASMR